MRYNQVLLSFLSIIYTVYYLEQKRSWIDGYTTDNNRIRQYLTVKNAIREAENQQRLFDKAVNAIDVKSKFIVDVVELNFTIRTLKIKKS